MSVILKDQDASSWGAMLNSYRSSYGASQFASVKQAADVPPRFPRTDLTPFGDPQHKNVHSIGADYSQPRYETNTKRHENHGRGPQAPWLKQPGRGATTKMRDPNERPGRMFEVMAHADRSDPRADSWVGNPLVDPRAGRHALEAPADPKGRKGLFDVLNQRNPGKPRDDSWLGHSLIDPAKGRRHNEDPAARQGRADLFPIIQQQAVHDRTVGGAAPRAKDPLEDLWIGHMKVGPSTGKARIEGVPATETRVDEQAFRWDGRANNALASEEIGPIGRRPGGEAGKAHGVPALLHCDPTYPEDPPDKMRRRVAPPVRDALGGDPLLSASRRRTHDSVKHQRYGDTYDLRWHGEEKGGFSDRDYRTMHQSIKGAIPHLRPYRSSGVGAAGPQTRVRGRPGATGG